MKAWKHTAFVASLLVLTAGPLWAQTAGEKKGPPPSPQPGEAKKGPTGYEKCMQMDFAQLMAKGFKNLGVEQPDPYFARDVSIGYFNCVAAMEKSVDVCGGISRIPDLFRKDDHEQRCRLYHHLFKGWEAARRKDVPAAYAECKKWFVLGKKVFTLDIPAERVCDAGRQIQPDDKDDYCARVTKQFLSKEPLANEEDYRYAEHVCRAFIWPTADFCQQGDWKKVMGGYIEDEGLPVKNTCMSFVEIRKAFKAGKPELCPPHPYYGPVCRAFLGDTGECDRVKNKLLTLYCKTHHPPEGGQQGPAPRPRPRPKPAAKDGSQAPAQSAPARKEGQD